MIIESTPETLHRKYLANWRFDKSPEEEDPEMFFGRIKAGSEVGISGRLNIGFLATQE